MEIHPNPAKAISDGAQSLDPGQWMQMMSSIKPYVSLWSQEREAEERVAAATAV